MIASQPYKPHTRHLYWTYLNDTGPTKKLPILNCITCSLSIEQTDQVDQAEDLLLNITIPNWFPSRPQLSTVACSHFDVSFAPDFTHFVLLCKGPGVPYAQLWKFNSINNTYGKFLFNNFV